MKAIWKDTVIAESDATVMVEGNHYFPESSVNREFISVSNHKTSCAWKGQASYYSITVDGGDQIRVPLANIEINAASLVETDKRVVMAQRLVNSGYEPAAVLAALDLPAIDHTGLPTVQLQGIAQIDPDAPQTVYPVSGV